MGFLCIVYIFLVILVLTHPSNFLCACRLMIMVARACSLLALLLFHVLLGGSASLISEMGNHRRFSGEMGRGAPLQLSEGILREFELRLLNMFGLKRRPTPSKNAIIPPYMLELYHLHKTQKPTSMDYHLERAASRANTVRSFHHEGKKGIVAFLLSPPNPIKKNWTNLKIYNERIGIQSLSRCLAVGYLQTCNSLIWNSWCIACYSKYLQIPCCATYLAPSWLTDIIHIQYCSRDLCLPWQTQSKLQHFNFRCSSNGIIGFEKYNLNEGLLQGEFR